MILSSVELGGLGPQRGRIILLILCAVTVCTWLATATITSPYSRAAWSSPTSSPQSSDAAFARPPSQRDWPWDDSYYPPDRPRIILMQHVSYHDPDVYRLQNISIRQHERYTLFWRYGYHVSDASYVPQHKSGREKGMNKVYALLELAEQQMTLGDGKADWI